MRQIDISTERQWVTVIDKREKIQVTEHPVVGGGVGGLRDFGEMSTISVVLPADHGSRAVTGGGTEYRMSADTKQTQPDDVKCFNCCFRQDEEGLDWSCTKKKRLPARYALYGASVYWKRGRILADFVDCNWKRVLSVACCAGTVCLCGSTEALWRSSEFREIAPPP